MNNTSPTEDRPTEDTDIATQTNGLWHKIKGGHAKPPSRASLSSIMIAWCGGVIAIAALSVLTDITQYPLLLGSFGATCVLIFGFPESPFSQPRNVILGHFLSSLTGLIFIVAFGVTWWSTALALATAIAVMQLTRTVHPPAGSNPVIIMLTHATWPFLVMPTLVGAVILCVVAVIFHALTR